MYEQWFLYKLFGKTGELLYVGVARNVPKRVKAHRRSKTEWCTDITTVTSEPCANWRDALAMERDAIVLGKPVGNIAHNVRAALPDIAPESLSTKQRLERWNEAYAMKAWYSFAYTASDGGALIELPIFSLAGHLVGRNYDQSTWSWKSIDGLCTVAVQPGKTGRASLFDKDILIFLISQNANALASGRGKSKSRVLRLDVHRYLMSLQRTVNPVDYERFMAGLERLRTTRITSENWSNDGGGAAEFNIIESWIVIDKDELKGRPITVDVTLSSWLFEIMDNGHIFPITRDYFQMQKPIVRRLYELARAHCDSLLTWNIDHERLYELSAYSSGFDFFCGDVNALYTTQNMPGFHLIIDSVNDLIRIYPKKTKYDPVGHLPFL